jgi:hypothetical protein
VAGGSRQLAAGRRQEPALSREGSAATLHKRPDLCFCPSTKWTPGPWSGETLSSLRASPTTTAHAADCCRRKAQSSKDTADLPDHRGALDECPRSQVLDEARKVTHSRARGIPTRNSGPTRSSASGNGVTTSSAESPIARNVNCPWRKASAWRLSGVRCLSSGRGDHPARGVFPWRPRNRTYHPDFTAEAFGEVSAAAGKRAWAEPSRQVHDLGPLVCPR